MVDQCCYNVIHYTMSTPSSYSVSLFPTPVLFLLNTRVYSSPRRLLSRSPFLATLPPLIRLTRRTRSVVIVKDRSRASLSFIYLEGVTRTASRGNAGERANLGGTFEIDSFEASLGFHSILLRFRLKRGQLYHLLEFLSVNIKRHRLSQL